MIIFKTVRWKNFLSTGNAWTEIKLDRSPNTLIVGENGSGKSTILDALCFGLFNKAFRKINRPQLVNTINEKDLMVEVVFTIGSKEYLIRRGAKPNIFEIHINGDLQNQPGSTRDYQDLLERIILKLNFSSFTQIVILGSTSFVPFMQLTAASRREVIEDLLDIQIFSNMNLLLKDRISKNKNSIQEAEYTMNIIKEKMTIQREYIGKMKAKNDNYITQFQKDIEDFTDAISHQHKDKQAQVKLLDALKVSLEGESSTLTKTNKVASLIEKLKTKHKKAHKRIQFYEDNDNCPTCEQIIDTEIKANKILDIQSTITETTNAVDVLSKEHIQLRESIDRYDNMNSEVTSIQKKIMSIDASIDSNQKSILKIQNNISKILEADDDDDTEARNSLKLLRDDLAENENLLEEFTFDKELFNTAGSMLKDGGIKTKIIRQYIPVMNKLINKYLASLDFFINFELDEEFKEVIKSRYRDVFSYASFSEGEKMRIDLALLFTWRAIAKLRNSTNTNLLILDEVFDASLDTNGCDEFLKLLQQVAIDTNIFVISHKGDILYDKFHSQIRFEKTKNFSRIAK
jgi:DNA repair exonuclease SbcCD ATPase subunit